MFTKTRSILATEPLDIMPMGRREWLATRAVTLNGKPAYVAGVEDVQPTLVDPQSGLCQPTTWDHLAYMVEFQLGRYVTLNGWRTTSYFLEGN